MAIHRFIVQERTKENPDRVGKAMSWDYYADHEKLTFTQEFGRGPDDIVVEGDYIGKMVMFQANGYDSKFVGVVTPPSNPIFRTLWDYGFERRSRVHWDDIQRAGSWDQLVLSRCKEDFPASTDTEILKDINTVIIWKVDTADGKPKSILIATSDGKLPNGRYFRISYVNRYATEADAAKWKEMHDANRV